MSWLVFAVALIYANGMLQPGPALFGNWVSWVDNAMGGRCRRFFHTLFHLTHCTGRYWRLKFKAN
jgi:hypothetical protein